MELNVNVRIEIKAFIQMIQFKYSVLHVLISNSTLTVKTMNNLVNQPL
ncbi:MAG: hypothetical protein ACTS4U_01435 [Candidatus Hodgkinia cicadicola]